MKRAYIPLFFIVFIFVGCTDEEIIKEKDSSQCSTEAVIRDYSGLDGCNYVLELNDGSILEPVQLVSCGPPPESIMTLHDPLADYQIDGLKVFVDYEDFPSVSICMVGKTVRVTCITERSQESSD